MGVVWIDLTKESYGIHGTPDPERIGKTYSHGCIRLTNLDALDLTKRMRKGMPVDFVDEPSALPTGGRPGEAKSGRSGGPSSFTAPGRRGRADPDRAAKIQVSLDVGDRPIPFHKVPHVVLCLEKQH